MADSFITRRGGGGLSGIALIYCAFPADATSVTCSNGTKTYSVPAKWLSSGGYCFAVNAEGTWTLTAKKGTTDSDTATVNVQAQQQYTVELSFMTMFYDQGDECTAITGGWATGGQFAYGDVTVNPTNIVLESRGGNVFARTKNEVDMSKIKTLYLDFTPTRITDTDAGMYGIAPRVVESHPAYSVKKDLYQTTSPAALDVSSVTGSHYIYVSADSGGDRGFFAMNKVWGE